MSEALMNIAIVRVIAQPQKRADKHGEQPVLLDPLAGTVPFKCTVAGTLANSAGWIAGSVHCIVWSETAPDPQYGRQFNLTELFTVLDDEQELVIKSNMSDEQKASIKSARQEFQSTILSYVQQYGSGRRIESEELNQTSAYQAPSTGQDVVPDQD
jgi:hypothetical protein